MLGLAVRYEDIIVAETSLTASVIDGMEFERDLRYNGRAEECLGKVSWKRAKSGNG